jgi:pantoate--beta-alanine ligase
MLEEERADAVFMPSVPEIYPQGYVTYVSLKGLTDCLCGRSRPGHFDGVATVVTKLFNIVRPDMAFFGQKDFQQLTIIKELIRQTGNKVKIIGCPIIRESDGLAMSSRNQLLEPEIRNKAYIIFRTLSEAAAMVTNNEITVIKEFVKNMINGTEGLSIEYFEIVDDIELIPLKNKSEVRKEKKYFGCIAVKAGKIRLIDNIEISLL